MPIRSLILCLAISLAAAPMLSCGNSGGKKKKVRITSISPKEGPATGGTTVRISTKGFRDDFTVNLPLVTFAGLASPSVTPISASQVDAVTPASPVTGDVAVQITATLEARSALKRGGYRYLAAPPVVVSTSPADLAGDVPVTDWVRVTFDRDMNPATLDPGSISIDGLGAGSITTDVSYDPATFTAIAVPRYPLAVADSFTVTVAATVEGAGGRAMGAPYVFAFDTQTTTEHVLLSEVCVTDASSEFVELFNPLPVPVSLDGYYLADSTWFGGVVQTQYYEIPESFAVGGAIIGTADDFVIGFPPGSSIAPGEYQTVALPGSGGFESVWGVPPTYEISDDGGAPDAIPNMEPIAPGSVGTTARLTNAGELVVLFYWGGQADLLSDVDYVIWGNAVTDPNTPEAADKTGIALDGPDGGTGTTTYLDDTPLASQIVVDPLGHSPGNSFQRVLPLLELSEIAAGGNGITGHDETSEDLSVTSGEWVSSLIGTPNMPGP